MRYVIVFVAGFFFLFWDGYYNDWNTSQQIKREADRLISYVM